MHTLVHVHVGWESVHEVESLGRHAYLHSIADMCYLFVTCNAPSGEQNDFFQVCAELLTDVCDLQGWVRDVVTYA